MSASVFLILEVKVVTQKGDRVGVTGSHPVLGSWQPDKIKYMKPKKTIHDSNIWSLKLNVPIGLEKLEYRYVVCRRSSSSHEDDLDDNFIIRHWEAGINCRHRTIKDIALTPTIDIYGQFPADGRMFVDQGWLLGETEVQLRFFKDPIHMFKKRHRGESYNVKCSTVNLLQLDVSTHAVYKGTSMTDDYFDQVIHASNPHIRVTSLGKYRNKEQTATGMEVSTSDYVIYKLRTCEPDSHGIKIDFYAADQSDAATYLGYANILPVHLTQGSGSLILAINGMHGFPVGQVTVHYLVAKPCHSLKCDLSKSFSKYWNRTNQTLEIGHRGLGDTHSRDINSTNEFHKRNHENTLKAFQMAGECGADFVEFDVQLSKDKIPIIWHDFRVSILLRKKQRGHHRVHHIPVNELTYAQLQDLRVDFAKMGHSVDLPDVDSHDGVCYTKDQSALLEPFPTLQRAFEVVDDTVGFYVELKYPQDVFPHNSQDNHREELLESYFERNDFLDPILKTIFDHAGNRRLVLASFDPDICIMTRLKQNRYPVIFLIEDNGRKKSPFFKDIRTQSITTAVALARSEKFLGLSVNAASLLRYEEKLLEKILKENMIVMVWGAEANSLDVRTELKDKGVHAICYDEIHQSSKLNIFRAEHDEEKISKLVTSLSFGQSGSSPGVSPSPSLVSSRTSSLTGSAPNLLALTTSEALLQESSTNGGSLPGTVSSESPQERIQIVPEVHITHVTSSSDILDRSISDRSLDKRVGVTPLDIATGPDLAEFY